MKNKLLNKMINNYEIKINSNGDWGLGIGDWAQSPIPNLEIKYKNIIKRYFLINIFLYIFINYLIKSQHNKQYFKIY